MNDQERLEKARAAWAAAKATGYLDTEGYLHFNFRQELEEALGPQPEPETPKPAKLVKERDPIFNRLSHGVALLRPYIGPRACCMTLGEALSIQTTKEAYERMPNSVKQELSDLGWVYDYAKAYSPDWRLYL